MSRLHCNGSLETLEKSKETSKEELQRIRIQKTALDFMNKRFFSVAVKPFFKALLPVFWNVTRDFFGHCSNHWKFLIICSSLRKDISVEWWTLAYPQWMNCANVKTWNLVGGLSSLAPTIYLARLHGFLVKECKTNQISLSTTTTTKSKIYLLQFQNAF